MSCMREFVNEEKEKIQGKKEERKRKKDKE